MKRRVYLSTLQKLWEFNAVVFHNQGTYDY